MNDIRLSICMPTYNFGRFIGEALSSIIPQATEDVEIVVVDGASIDNTSDIVRSYQINFPRLRYHLLERKGGIDLDLVKTVEFAKGQYCWLFSADDIMESNAIKRMLDEIKSGHDIYLCNRKETDISLNTLGVRYFLKESEEDRLFNFENNKDLYEYLDKATSIAALFSYMSSIVFLRKKWNMIKNDDEFIGTLYHHAYKLISFIGHGCTLKYIRCPIVICRLGNDSFTGNSLAKRALFDINGYTLILHRFFLEPPEINKIFKEMMQKEFKNTHLNSLKRILLLKIYSEKDDWKLLKNKLLEICGFNILLYLIDILPHSHVWGKTIKTIRKLPFF